MHLMLSQFVRLRHVKITPVAKKPVFGDDFEMRLIGMTVIGAGTREHGWTVGTLCLLVLVGVDERAVKLDGLHAGEVTTTFRTAVPIFHKLFSERRIIEINL